MLNLNSMPEAIRAIAKQAIERKTGARGLRSIIEKVMTDIMYEIPSREDVAKMHRYRGNNHWQCYSRL